VLDRLNLGCGRTNALSAADRLISGVLAGARWLILPLVILLFLQWPLRDLVKGYSREANDLGQWLFALYVAAGFTAAMRSNSHLAADLVARRYSVRSRVLILRLGLGLGLLPWALLVLIVGRGIVLPSIALLEAFPDTSNPGYFIIKAAVWVLAGLALLQALIDLTQAPPAMDP
jgi:TRAP-type mannitol/chloroaromatic compound transport system permease small subunit